MQKFVACFLLFCAVLLLIPGVVGVCSSLPRLTIDRIEGNNGIIKILYTTSDPMGRLLSTANWKYSTNGGATWIIINQSAIQNNEPKLSGQHFILWNTNEGLNNLSEKYYPFVLFRMEAFDIDVGPAGEWRRLEDMSFPRAFLTAAIVNDDIVNEGDIFLKVNCICLHDGMMDIIDHFPTNSVMIGFFNPFKNIHNVQGLAKKNMTCFSSDSTNFVASFTWSVASDVISFSSSPVSNPAFSSLIFSKLRGSR